MLKMKNDQCPSATSKSRKWSIKTHKNNENDNDGLLIIYLKQNLIYKVDNMNVEG